MHPLLENLSIYTWMDIIKSNDTCISLLGDLGLVPDKTDVPPACPKCSGSMNVRTNKNYILKWQWVCKKRRKKENRCYAVLNPLEGTFFENTRLPLTDVFALIFGYFLRIGVKEIQDHINCWRKARQQKVISNSSVIDLYARCKQIIFIALRKRGEITENLEKIEITKLFKKYSKSLEFAPFFRNLVYHFLMDVKSECPCLGTKEVSASTSSSSVNTHVNNENKSNLPSPTNPSLGSISGAVKSQTMNVENPKIPSSVAVITTSKNFILPDSATLNTAQSAFPASTGSKKVKISNCNTAVVQTPNNNRPVLESAQSSNSNTSALVNVSAVNNNTAVLESAQSSNSNTSAIVNASTVNNNIAGLEGAQVSNITATVVENVQNSNNNATAIAENVQSSHNSLAAVSSPSTVSSAPLSVEDTMDIVPFIDENMEIVLQEVTVKTTE